MPNRTGPDRDKANDVAPDSYRTAATDPEPPTEVIAKADGAQQLEAELASQAHERRFTAPGFDANETTVIPTPQEPVTEVLQTANRAPERTTTSHPKTATPQLIPPQLGSKLRRSNRRDWGWALALILVVLTLAAIAILGTVLLTRSTKHSSASPEDQVRTTIRDFDIAVQNGNLTTLRSLTCGATRDGYINYDEHAWAETYRMVSAARQYPVIATIDQVVINGEYAEANVTTFMAYDPQVRSTRSFDLRFLDNRWKICQSPSG